MSDDPVAEARLRLILGPRGEAALADALAAMDRVHPGLAGLRVLRAEWTRAEWTFTMRADGAGRRFSLAVPHSGHPLVIRELDAGAEPGR